jgi:hypothetical protein
MKHVQPFESFISEAKETPWDKLNRIADEKYGEFGFQTLDTDDMEDLIDMKKANKIADKEYGEFGFTSLDYGDMEDLINNNPKLIKEQFLNESAFDAILKYIDNPYGIGADSAEFDQVGRDRQIVFRFTDKRDREATRQNLKDLGIQGKKMTDAMANKGHAYPYELVVFESVEDTTSDLNEANGDKITIHWSGLPIGAEGTIGTFIVSPKVHDQIEDEMGRSISIDFEDENVSGKLASFKNVMDVMKKSDYGKLFFSESADLSVNEGYNRWYIETWYDHDGRKVQLLGSDGTTVTKRPPFDKDVENHHDRITKLKKIKPFLVGNIEYRAVDGQDRVLKTYNRIIEESAVNENEITIDGTDVFFMAKIDRDGRTHLQFNPNTSQISNLLDYDKQKDQLAKTIIGKLKGKKIDLVRLLKDANVSEDGILFEVNLYQLIDAVQKALK